MYQRAGNIMGEGGAGHLAESLGIGRSLQPLPTFCATSFISVM